MKVYVFKEWITGCMGVYSTKKKACEARNKIEMEESTDEEEFRFAPDEYEIREIELDAPIEE